MQPNTPILSQAHGHSDICSVNRGDTGDTGDTSQFILESRAILATSSSTATSAAAADSAVGFEI